MDNAETPPNADAEPTAAEPVAPAAAEPAIVAPALPREDAPLIANGEIRGASPVMAPRCAPSP